MLGSRHFQQFIDLSTKRVSRNGNDEIFYGHPYSYSVTLSTQVILQDSHISLRDSVVIKREEPKPNWFYFG